MPEKATLQRARQGPAEGKAPSTQAGEFVREEMDHIREGKHGARSTKQAIAIGLSKARRSGVDAPAPEGSHLEPHAPAGGPRRPGRLPGRLDPAVSRDAQRADPGRSRGRLARRLVPSGPQGCGAALEGLAERRRAPGGRDAKAWREATAMVSIVTNVRLREGRERGVWDTADAGAHGGGGEAAGLDRGSAPRIRRRLRPPDHRRNLADTRRLAAVARGSRVHQDLRLSSDNLTAEPEQHTWYRVVIDVRPA